MNGVIDNIKQRRSIRSFMDTKIERKILEELIDAARFAPTGANSQPWRFVVIEDADFRMKLAEMALPIYKDWLNSMPESFKEMRKDIDAKVSDPVYYNAPAVIFVIGKGITADLDCPMACQNIMLAARSFGIGSCWVYMGQFPLKEREIQDRLALKEDEKVYGPIVLGYPDADFPEAPEKKEPEVRWI
jgi:nitroreductase